MDEDTEADFHAEEDYYTFLNIPKNATPEEINVAYRSLSRVYHPDKHVDADKKDRAELLFNRTKKAYEVLSDPHKRAIYDSLGMKGLETEGWEIVHRTKTPNEIREEYERLARERSERRLQQCTNPRGNITVHVNATEIFNPYAYDLEERSFPTIEVSGMSISQSIEAPMTTSDTITMSGDLSSYNGNGSGGFMISGRRLINKGWLELDIGGGGGPVVAMKGSRFLTNNVSFNGNATLNFRQNGIIPGLVGTLAVQLDKHTVGYLTYNAGLQSSMSTVLEHSTENHHFALTCTIGITNCAVSASYMRRLVEHDMKLRLSAKVGTFGFVAEYGAEKKVSKYSSVIASVSIGSPTGVNLKIKLVRSTQSYVFPIHLSEEIIPAAVFYATITPLVAWFVIKKTIIEPMNAEQQKRKIEKVREVNQKRMMEKKKEAEAAIDLMRVQYERICTDEEKREGLLITLGQYGKFDEEKPQPDTSSSQNVVQEQIIDVTVPLQCLVKESKLILYSSSKSELPGFYDPCAGEDKLLKIDYKFKNVNYSVSIMDLEVLRLPASDL